MKQHISKLVCSALLGAAIAGSAFVGSAQAQSAGSLAVPLITSAEAGPVVKAEPVEYRHWRRYHRRHYRHHHGHGGAGIYFNFGNGSFSLTVPERRYYPRYHHRRYYDYPRRNSTAHVNWCSARYRTYEAWNNTFQPYHGSRRQCISPYY